MSKKIFFSVTPYFFMGLGIKKSSCEGPPRSEKNFFYGIRIFFAFKASFKFEKLKIEDRRIKYIKLDFCEIF